MTPELPAKIVYSTVNTSMPPARRYTEPALSIRTGCTRRRRCERLGGDKAGEGDDRKTRCQQPHSTIVAVPLGDERRHGRGGVAAQCIIQRCKQRAAQGVDQIHSQSTASRTDDCGPKIAACSPGKERAEGWRSAADSATAELRITSGGVGCDAMK